MRRPERQLTTGWVGAAVIAWLLAGPASLWAADTTPPTTPVVTDDGVYTTVTTQLHATWTSTDPETGVAEHQYLIRDTSTSGPIVVNWTSAGTNPSVTHTGLSLLQGRSYYLQARAKNGDGLWSAVGSSNGIRVDTTPPGAPGQPTEGSSTIDYDYDGDGAYSVYWPAALDAESGIAAYELQERVGAAGAWTALTSTVTGRSFAVSGRLANAQYFYWVRAKNGAGLWGPWSAISDGILIDKTAPSPVTVTDDGTTTNSMSQLHAVWTVSTDAESGIAEYQYLIRQDSTAGTIIVNWTSVGPVTGVTKTGLTLVNGKAYFIGVRAKNAAQLFSSIAYSNGITVVDTIPPTGTITINGAATYTTSTAVTLALSATDNAGPVTQMQFSNDGVSYSAPESYTTSKSWTLASGDGAKTVTTKFQDTAGNWSAPASASITLDTTPPAITVMFPVNGAVLGAQ